MGLFQAMLDAIQGSDEQIGGKAVTQLTTPLMDTDAVINVVSTIGFGEFKDGLNNARLIVGGEIISATGRTDTTFTGLTRGVDNTKIKSNYQVNTVVFDFAENSSALDLTKRGFLVDFAIGPDLDVIGRNLGLIKCPGLDDDQWRDIIKRVAYSAKQTPVAFQEALLALLGAGQFDLVERVISNPNNVIVRAFVSLATMLRGRFYLNGGERQDTTAPLNVTVDYDVVGAPLAAQAATGTLRIVSGAFLADGETFILDDGVTALTFEFDLGGGGIGGDVAIVYLVTDSEATVRDAVIAAVNGAGALDMTASPQPAGAGDEAYRVNLVNGTPGVAGNVPIGETVTDPAFAFTGMSGGQDAGTIGVLGVFDDTVLSRTGYRDGLTNYFTGGSFAGKVVTLGSSPGAAGTAVLVDYGAFSAHYLADDETIVDSDDTYGYLGGGLTVIECLLDQIRAAGVGVTVTAKL